MSLAHDTCRECGQERTDEGTCGCDAARELLYWKVLVEITDEPAHWSATVIVGAANRTEAKGLAKPAAIRAYFDANPGWASSPHIDEAVAQPFDMPEVGIVVAYGRHDR